MSNLIQYSKNIVGCRIKKEIFIHPKLYKYPELYKAIVLHENKHSDGIGLGDFRLDLFNEELTGHKKEFYKFIFTHPRTLLGFLPLTKVGKYWAFDLQLFIAWVIVFLFGYLIGGNL